MTPDTELEPMILIYAKKSVAFYYKKIQVISATTEPS
jgi:hypothetical protein